MAASPAEPGELPKGLEQPDLQHPTPIPTSTVMRVRTRRAQRLVGYVPHNRSQSLDRVEGQRLHPAHHGPIARQASPAHEVQEDRIALQHAQVCDPSLAANRNPIRHSTMRTGR